MPAALGGSAGRTGVATAAGLGAGAGSTRGGAGLGSGFDAGAAMGGWGCAGRMSTGSSKKVYSRTSLPLAQVSSIRASTMGSLTGWFEARRIKYWPSGRRSTVMRTPSSDAVYSTPACRYASGDASRAASEPASSRETEVKSISARNGWPRPDCTVNFPRPAAWACPSSVAPARARAAAIFLNLNCFTV